MALEPTGEEQIMKPDRQTAPVSTRLVWLGRILSAISVLMILYAAVTKVTSNPSVVQTMGQLGYPAPLVPIIGVLELTCLAVYVIPQTTILGAILLTGLLGGAISTNVRVGNPGFILPAILCLLAWGGLYLRDARLRELIPLQK
jgi:hypothetical protein